MIKMSMSGINKALEGLTKELAAIDDAATAGLFAAGLVVEGEAVKRAPKRDGHLRNTAFTDADGNKVVVGFSAEYALRQHEELEFKHKEGEAKYLENAAKVKEKEVVEKVKEALKGVL